MPPARPTVESTTTVVPKQHEPPPHKPFQHGQNQQLFPGSPSSTNNGGGGNNNNNNTTTRAVLVKNNNSASQQTYDPNATILLIHAEAVEDTVVLDVNDNNEPHTPDNTNNNSKSVLVIDQQTKKRRRMWIAAIVALFLIGGVVGILLAVMTNGSIPASTFTQVGGDITPNDKQQPFFGLDVAVSSNGNRIAVASISTVAVYELKNSSSSSSSSWQQLGKTINVVGADDDGQNKITSLPKILDHGLISLAMGRQGDIIAVGYGEAANSTGMVNVYQYINGTWVGLGPPLVGKSGDQFGTAVDLSVQDPILLAVDAPGYNDGAGSVRMLQYNNIEQNWTALGDLIVGEISTTILGLGGSVSLNGTRVAAAGRSLLDPTATSRSPVVRTFDYKSVSNSWMESDAGYAPPGALISSTGWTVDLSAEGNRMVISNSYLTEEDFVNKDPAGLFVRVFAFSDDQWNPYGGNLHEGITGPKSGYVVALSDDGSVIGMGDPGTSSGGRNVNGHAHIYRNDPGKMSFYQSGPNLDGKNHADAFGFAVAISGDGRKLVVGIPRSRAAGDESGLVQVYETLHA
jgi:FG-GAP repeat